MSADQALVLAHWLGAHALGVFLALLCTLLLLVTWVAWAWQGSVRRRRQAAFSQAALLLRNVAAGLVIVLTAAAGFAEIAEQLGPGGRMSLADEALSASIRAHVGGGTLRAFALLTQLGDVRVLTALGVVVALWLWWRGQRTLALGWVLALVGNALLNPMLKHLFERVRPLHEPGAANELGWSFPSGHTSGATVAYGMLAYIALRTLPAAWHLPALLGAITLAFTVGSSRVFLQVHFVSDVVAGFASGTAWLVVCILSLALSGHYRFRPTR